MKTDSQSLDDMVRAVVQTVEETRSTCLRCDNFDEGAEQCKLAGARPPARVIAYGCPQFIPGIPF